MGGGKGKGNRKNAKKEAAQHIGDDDVPTPNAEGLIAVDPRRIRFQYSKIRPHFSGCGRSVVSTLDSIRNGELSPGDLPPIQVLVGPVDEADGQRWYFSLNNRRLWVFKRCADEGLLSDTNGKIWVRVREPKSQKEKERYSIENCAVEAKFIRERKPDAAPKANNEAKVEEDEARKKSEEEDQTKDTGDDEKDAECDCDEEEESGQANNEEEESSEDESIVKKTGNIFAMVGDDSSSDEDSSDDDDDEDDGGGTFSNRFAGLDL